MKFVFSSNTKQHRNILHRAIMRHAALYILEVALASLAFSRGFSASRTAEQPCDTLVETSSWHVSDIIVQDSTSLALMVSSSTPFARIHHQITHPAGNLTKTGRCTFALIQETIGNVCPHVREILVTRKTNVRHPFLFRGHELVNAEYTSPDSTIVPL